MRYDQMRVPRGLSRKWEIIIGDETAERASGVATAADVKAEHRLLRDVSVEALRSVRLVGSGTTLLRGERYIDLHDPARGEFAGDGYARVRPGQRVVMKGDAPAEVWRAIAEAADRVVGRTAPGLAMPRLRGARP